MKDLILIGSYCNNVEKENILRDLVKSIDRSFFDLMVFSHLSVPVDIQNACNYFLYDSENELVSNYQLKTQFWIQVGERRINTTEFQDQNTFIPVFRQLVIGSSVAKLLGYDKIHYIEYDCSIESFDELIDNSIILDENSCVFYTDSGLIEPLIYFPVISINTKTINSDLTSFSRESILNWLEQSEMNAPEFTLSKLLTKDSNFHIKKKEVLSKNGIRSGLTYDNPIFMIAPFYNSNSQEVDIVSYSSNYDDINFSVILNDIPLSSHTLNKNQWLIFPISKKEELKKLTILVDDIIYRVYDFGKIDINLYFNYNYM